MMMELEREDKLINKGYKSTSFKQTHTEYELPHVIPELFCRNNPKPILRQRDFIGDLSDMEIIQR